MKRLMATWGQNGLLVGHKVIGSGPGRGGNIDEGVGEAQRVEWGGGGVR